MILRCFVVRIWLRLDSNRALRDFLAMDYYPYNRGIMKACGLTSLPDRGVLSSYSGSSKGVFLDECQELIHDTGTDVIAVLGAVVINLLGAQTPSANT